MTMKGLIKRIWFAWRYRRAVKKAVRMADMTGLKYYVIYINKGLKVVPKKTVKELVARHRFKKGVTVADIEKRALFVTR